MKTDKEIIDFFKELYDNNSTFCANEYISSDLSVEVSRNKNVIEVEVRMMYKYVPVDFKILKHIGDFFETDKINLKKAGYEGCETCDYGSSYIVTFYIKK